MVDGRHIEYRFWLCLGALLVDHADIGHMTKMAIFTNSRWRTAAILKIALSPYRAVNYPISIKFGSQMQIYIPCMEI